ncbi:MAG: Crp/Fnr family transcriptional regulator [Alphaproteobacteria bacterium]|nr:Crp/Fnr family transcriptional regulator [Alphaproteobacteria bacterium]
MKLERSSSQHLGYHTLFQNQPAVLQALTPHVQVKAYEKDDVVLHHGDTAASLWLVLKGWVKLTRQTPDGKESIVGLCTEGDMFGEAALFPNASYPYHAQILTAHTELALIPSAIIRTLIAENAALSGTIMALLNQRTSQAQLKLEQMSTMSASQRLGCFLLRLCHTQADGSKTLQIPVEKHILATYLGMKPETLSRSQQQLKPLGITVSGHEITIQTIEKLRDFVCNSCSESGSCDIEEMG